MPTAIRTLCAVGLTAALSAVAAGGLLRVVLAHLRGRGEWIVDGMAQRRWGHAGQIYKKENER